MSQYGSGPTLTKGHERKDGHGISTTVRAPEIRDDTAGVGERSSGEASSKEAEDDERADVGREGASDLEACEFPSVSYRSSMRMHGDTEERGTDQCKTAIRRGRLDDDRIVPTAVPTAAVPHSSRRQRWQ